MTAFPLTPALPMLFPDPPAIIQRGRFDYTAFSKAIEAYIDSLRAVVDPLERVDADDLGVETRTLSTSYYRETGRYSRRLQHVLRVEIEYTTLRRVTFALAFCNKDVGVTEVLAVPGYPHLVAHLYYTGVPFETCYRRHELVLLWPDVGRTQRWRRLS